MFSRSAIECGAVAIKQKHFYVNKPNQHSQSFSQSHRAEKWEQIKQIFFLRVSKTAVRIKTDNSPRELWELATSSSFRFCAARYNRYWFSHVVNILVSGCWVKIRYLAPHQIKCVQFIWGENIRIACATKCKSAINPIPSLKAVMKRE